MGETTWTHDLPPGDLAALLGRLRSCDGLSADAAVIVWEQCQALINAFEGLRAEADLYRRGYEAMAAADVSEYLALCGAIRRYESALESIEQTGHNPADLAPDLVGLPDRYERLVDLLALLACRALHENRVPPMTDDAVCKGDWSLGTACGRCSRCRETEPSYLRDALADAARKAGEYAHWANQQIDDRDQRIAVLEAETAQLREALERLTLERDGYRKAEELLRAGMASQAELMDGLKQEKRRLQTGLQAAADALLSLCFTSSLEMPSVPWNDGDPDPGATEKVEYLEECLRRRKAEAEKAWRAANDVLAGREKG